MRRVDGARDYHSRCTFLLCFPLTGSGYYRCGNTLRGGPNQARRATCQPSAFTGLTMRYSLQDESHQLLLNFTSHPSLHRKAPLPLPPAPNSTPPPPHPPPPTPTLSPLRPCSPENKHFCVGHYSLKVICATLFFFLQTIITQQFTKLYLQGKYFARFMQIKQQQQQTKQPINQSFILCLQGDIFFPNISDSNNKTKQNDDNSKNLKNKQTTKQPLTLTIFRIA